MKFFPPGGATYEKIARLIEYNNCFMRHFFIALFLLSATFLSAQKDQTLFGNGGLRLSGFWFGGTSNMHILDAENDIYRGGHFVFEFNDNWLIGWSNFRINAADWDLKSNGAFIGYSHNSDAVVHSVFHVSVANGRLSSELQSRDRVWTVVPAGGVEVNVLRWFRLGLEGGYRFVSDVEIPGLQDGDISGGFATLRLRFGYSWK